jgi:ADP-ribose pyrophosphatase
MNKPIVPHEIRRVFTGRIFSVTLESITLPRGERLEAEVVRHPGSVVLIPVTQAGEIVLVRQYRHAIGRWAWELPAGSLKHDEDPGHAAIRECHEEIGQIPQSIERMGSFYPTPGYCDEEMHFYRATRLRQPSAEDPAAQQDMDEDIEARPFALDEIRRMISAGEIIDLVTMGLTARPYWTLGWTRRSVFFTRGVCGPGVKASSSTSSTLCTR